MPNYWRLLLVLLTGAAPVWAGDAGKIPAFFKAAPFSRDDVERTFAAAKKPPPDRFAGTWLNWSTYNPNVNYSNSWREPQEMTSLFIERRAKGQFFVAEFLGQKLMGGELGFPRLVDLGADRRSAFWRFENERQVVRWSCRLADPDRMICYSTNRGLKPNPTTHQLYSDSVYYGYVRRQSNKKIQR